MDPLANCSIEERLALVKHQWKAADSMLDQIVAALEGGNTVECHVAIGLCLGLAFNEIMLRRAAASSADCGLE